MAGDLKEQSLYDIFETFKIKPKVSLKGMYDARGETIPISTKILGAIRR